MPAPLRQIALWAALAWAAVSSGCNDAQYVAPDAGPGAPVEVALAFEARTSSHVISLPLQITGAALQLEESYPDGPWAALPVVASTTDGAGLDGDLLVAVGSVPPGRYARIRVDAFATAAVIEGGASLPVASHVEPIAALLPADLGSTLRATVELVLLDDPSGKDVAWLFAMSAGSGSE